MAKYYAGIGSRETPGHILNIMGMLGRFLGQNGWTLRSGAALGADKAFESGCDAVNGAKEIYLPWRGYNHNTSPLHPRDYPFTQPEIDFTAKFHPAWDKCSPSARALHQRNTRILMGMEALHGVQVTPVSFIICWTEDGLIKDGTGQALRIGNAMAEGGHDFKIINLGSAKDEKQLENMVNALEVYGKP